MTPRLGARIAWSCSAWMVATIECMVRSRARESCAISAPSPMIGRSAPVSSSASASSSSSSTPTTLAPSERSTRRRITRCGVAAVAW